MVWLYVSGQLTHISLILYVPFSGKAESKVSFWRWRAASITKFLFIEMEMVQIISCQRNVCLGRPRPCFLKIVFLFFSLQLANRSEHLAEERLRVCQNTYCQIVYLKSCTMLHLQVNNLSFADAMAQTYPRVKKVSQEDGTPTTLSAWQRVIVPLSGLLLPAPCTHYPIRFLSPMWVSLCVPFWLANKF